MLTVKYKADSHTSVIPDVAFLVMNPNTGGLVGKHEHDTAEAMKQDGQGVKFLDRGVIYLMNETGKTIDVIHINGAPDNSSHG